MSSSLLSKVDLFGYWPNMEVRRSTTYKTNFGAILSILIVLTIIYVIWYFGNEIIFKKKPNLITTLYNDADPLRINLTDENFVLALGLQNPDYSLYINESIYYLDVQHIIVSRGDNGLEVSTAAIDIIPCNRKNFTLLPEYFHLMDLKNLYCIKDTDTFITGDFGQAEWAYLQFSFKRCKNSTENGNKCKSPDEISARLDGGYFGMFISDTNIDSTNINEPSIMYGRNIFTTFSVRAYRDFWMFMRSIEINTDLGWLMDDFDTEYYFSIDNVRETWDYRDTSDIFFNFYIRPSSNRQVFDRSYLKAQTVAANIGGIIKFLFICGEIISYYFTRLRYREYLASIFFNCSIDIGGSMNSAGNGDKNSEVIQIHHKIGLTEKSSNTNMVSMVSQRQMPKNITIAGSKRAAKTDKVEIKRFTWCEIIRSMLYLKNPVINKKEAMLERAYTKLEVYFDWVHLIKKLIEVEIIKSYVFDERQNRIVSCYKNCKENKIEVVIF
jgi:hypothetical protein